MPFDQVVLITGAAKGIGAAIARAIAAPKTAIIINYNTSTAAAAALVTELTELGAGAAIAVQADISTADGAATLISATVAQFGTITGLVNNAGIYESAPASAAAAHFERVVAGNVMTFLYVTAAAVPHLADGGSVVNISSAVTRGAMDAYTRALAVELAPRRVRVNAVLPGMTKTRSDLPAAAEAMAAKVTPFGEIGRPEDVAAAVAFLLDPKSRWITGQSVGVSGGMAFSY
ncbi:hypothetical protein DFJ73DRAFT_755451 [Zopfochytrium polystomum]|nr:hypothetical protein DFJ73DRAFT_755451 [Zopfochytrium polystomum]